MNKKKVLIITYYWPPAGGPGVQRWLKFVKYLPEFNIEPVVFVPENPNYPIIDKSLVSEVSSNLNVLRLPINEPYKFAGFLSKKSSKDISKGIIPDQKKQRIIEKLLLYVRGNFFIPDARIGWVKPSTMFLSDYISKNNINTIVTSGPPHSLHLIGMELKKRLGVTWIADFRDPWTTIGYHKQLKLSKRAQQKHKELERQVLNTASQIIVTSSVTKKEFEAITSKPIQVITNGYDMETVGAGALDKKFSISHIGLLLSERNPEILWQVLMDLLKERQDFKNDFQLNFIGSVSRNVLDSLNNFNLTSHVNNIGYVSHKEAVVYQKSSQVLLLVEIDSPETTCIIPGKLFEYMVSNRPILAIGPKASDVENIIKETNSGHYFYYTDYDKIKATILKYYESFQNKKLESHPIGLQKYSRRNLTKELANMLID